MKRVVRALCSILALVIGCDVATAAAQDVPGSKDHPLLSRMANFRISAYKESEFDSHRFTGADKKPSSVEGHKYYLEYRMNQGAAEPGELKLRRNIQDALKKVGGDVVFDDNFNKVSTIVLRKAGKETWVEVRSYNNFFRMTIVERELMKQEVVANAQAMGNDLGSTGHVAIYGIFFETGKSDLKPESDAAIAEIATLLQADGALRLFVVGHTDNVGSLDANMKLSKDRADAVVQALVKTRGIDASRLKPFGNGPYAPVASNDSDEGRAKNRRVELVKQ
jgi:outer membrane protein OmpA-like peptidoglycan-associated protein